MYQQVKKSDEEESGPSRTPSKPSPLLAEQVPSDPKINKGVLMNLIAKFAGDDEHLRDYLVQRVNSHLSSLHAGRGMQTKQITDLGFMETRVMLAGWKHMYAVARRRKRPGVHVGDTGVEVNLSPDVQERVESWRAERGTGGSGGSSEKITAEEGIEYLDILAKARPSRINDANRGKSGDAMSNCSIVSTAALLGCMSSDVPASMGFIRGNQQATLFLSGEDHDSMGTKKGEAGPDVDGQIEGMRLYLEQVVSRQVSIAKRGKHGVQEIAQVGPKQFEIVTKGRSHLPFAEALAEMRRFAPGTQFIVYVTEEVPDKLPGSHFVYAELYGKDVVFQDWQPMMAPAAHNRRHDEHEAAGPERVPTTVNEPPRMPLAEEDSDPETTRMIFLALEPSPELVRGVIKENSAAAHNAFKG